MTSHELNQLVEQGYASAQEHEPALVEAFVIAYRNVNTRLVRRFRRVTGTVTAASDWNPPAGGIFDDQGSKEEAAAETAALHRQMLEAATMPLYQGTGMTFDIGSDAAQQLLDSMSGITDLVAEGIKEPALRVIGEAWNTGLSQGDAAQALTDALGAFGDTQAQVLARSSLNAISNGASQIGVQQLNAQGGNFGRKRWLDAHDNRVRPTHAEADGQTVDIRQPFTVGGASLQFPGDPSGPPDQILGCRCVLIYQEGVGTEVPPATLPFSQEATTMSSYTNPVNNSIANFQAGPATVTITVDTGQNGTSTEEVEPVAWQGTLAIEGYPTDDGRYLMPDGMEARDLPLTLMGMVAHVGEGHMGSEVAGKIEQIWREPALDLGPEAVRVMGSGHFDTGEFGMDIARMVGEDTLNGISVDLAIEDVLLLDPETLEPVDENTVDFADILSGNYLFGIKGKYMGATVCPMPAFADANDISIVASGERKMTVATGCGIEIIDPSDWVANNRFANVVASAAPLRPAASWFEDPKFDQITPLTFDEEGRVYGHLTTWGACHTGVLDRCATPFRSRSGYAYFHTGTIEVDDGSFISIGRISLDTNHAHLELDGARARSHYDHTGTVGAFVRAGEDRFGIWLAGAVRHDLPEAALRDMRANPPSGDWRRRELIGVLCVPFPGYPVPHQVLVASGGEFDEEEIVTMITGMGDFGAIPPRSTPVVDGTWDANANVSRISDSASAATLRKMYAWVDPNGDATAKASYKFPHHNTDSNGNVGAANMGGVRNAMSRLPQANIPAGDRAGVERHLQRHMDDFKRRQGGDGMSGEEFEASLDALSDLAGID